MMHLRHRLYGVAVCAALAAGLTACGGGSGGSSSSVTPTTPAGAAPTVPSFTTISSAPATLSGASQTLTLPTVPSVSNVGGSLHVQSSGAGSAAVMLAASGGGGGPATPAARRAFDASASITPLFYVGVTNTTNTPMQVSFSTLALEVPSITAGWAYALACYDPSTPNAGWNDDCAYGSSEVSVSGTTATFTLNRTFTIYPSVTLWFAPYAYETTESSPTPEPSESPIVPTPPPAPASLSGTYVGNANGESDEQYLEVSLTQTGSNVTGIYALVPDNKDNGAFGTLSGTISNGALTLTATQQYGGNCGDGTISATVAGTLINGTFTPTTSPTCAGGGGGSFGLALQSGITQTLSGTYNGTISDSKNGSGSLSIAITTPGTVFGGTATVKWATGSDTGAIVGFMVNATTAQFAVITNGSCAPTGTITLSGTTLNGTYEETGGSGSNCDGSGTFAVSQ